MTDKDKAGVPDQYDEKARELLDDPANFIRDPIAGPIPMHFNAFYGVLAKALRDAAELRPASAETVVVRVWQPIDTAPKDGTRIVLAKYDWAHGLGAFFPKLDDELTFGLWWMTVGYWSDKWLNWNDGVEPSGLASPTHWMPLPNPPAAAALEAPQQEKKL